MAEYVARRAKEAFDASQLLHPSERHNALLALKDALTTNKDAILKANAMDIEVSYLGCRIVLHSTDPLLCRPQKSRSLLARCHPRC